MKITTALLPLLLLICVTEAAHAAGHTGTRIVSGYVNLNDSANVYKALYDNTPVEPEFKLVPKFAIIGADNKFVFSTGASMKFTASYDWGNPVRNPSGMGAADISGSFLSDHNLYQMTAGGSGIYFNIIGFPGAANEIGLFLSVGVDKDANNTYRLGAGQIYMRYRDFQCGYATSLYNDRRADAYTIDAHGPCASGAHTTVGMNWQHIFNRHIGIGIGVEAPKAAYTQLDFEELDGLESMVFSTLTSHQYIPNFPFYVGYDWGMGHVRLSAIVRNIHYVDYITGRGHNVVGNALKLTGNAKAGPVNFFWMAQTGWASATCFLDNASSGLDLVPSDDNPGRLTPTQSWGCIAAMQWNILPNVFTTAQYSYLHNHVPRYTIRAATEWGDLMESGQSFTVNAVWKISSIFSTGIEYRHVDRRDQDHTKLGNNRVYGMLMMSF